MKHYIAKLGDQQVGKRSTKNRTYTHAVVAEADVDALRAYAGKDAFESNWKFAKDAVAGRTHYPPAPEALARYQEEAACATFKDYQQLLRARALKHIDQEQARGVYGFRVEGWCGRLDLAHKLAGVVAKRTGWYSAKNIQIVSAIEVTK